MVLKPAVRAIFKRDLRRWFGNPTGYVFITLFVLLCAAFLYWPEDFFQSNLANLDTLNEWYSTLMLFFIPAITMSIWAGERSQGTDELLLTLPAADTQIVLGKYLAGLGIYTAALLFSFPIVAGLELLGDPDWGLLFANYLGYWFLGGMLLACGMVGSQLSDNLTVAFILGAILCALVITAEDLVGIVAPGWHAVAGFGPISLFEDFARGVIAPSAVLLFGGMTAAFLYLNLLLLSRRHWLDAAEGIHLGVRFACLLVAAATVAVLAGGWSRLDTTVEQVHSLSQDTRTLLADLDPERPVFVQAYISVPADVPRDFVPTVRTLRNLLRQYDAAGGDALQVRIRETERYSDAAREAERNFGIRPQTRVAAEGGRERSFDIYLGLAFQSGLEEVVVPFLDKGLSVEYELTRSIRTVASADRRKIGVLDTDVKLFGGMDFQSMQQSPQWQIVRELELQYDVVRVDPGADYPTDLDVLVAILPSSLAQEDMDRLAAAMREGIPTLVIDDPFPASAPGMAPTDPKGGQRNPFMGGPPPQQKGNINALLREFDINFSTSTVVWDQYNPHPQFELEPEIVIIGAASGSTAPFNPDEPITAGLQEVLTLFPGAVREGDRDNLEFTHLLRSTQLSGDMPMHELFTQSFFGRQMNPRRLYRRDTGEKTLACRVRSKAGADKPTDVIFVADIDMISSQFFRFRAMGVSEFQFDNVTFVLNCVDDLAGDASFIALRKRRPQHRTLVAIEEEEREFEEAWLREKQEAEQFAQVELDKAQAALDGKVAAIEQRADLDATAKEIQKASAREVEERRLEVRRQQIEDLKAQRIDEARAAKLRAENAIHGRYRLWALLLAPIPAIFVGFASAFMRLSRERETSSPSRRVGGES